MTPLNLELTCRMGTHRPVPPWSSQPGHQPYDLCGKFSTSLYSGNSESSVARIIFYHHVLAWPKSSLGFFCTILWENLNKLSGQPRGTAPDVQLAPRKCQLLLLSHLSLVLLIGAKITQMSEMGFCVSFDRGLCQNPL